jgi:hypothetical protein
MSEQNTSTEREDWTSKYDRAWKGILDHYLRQFLAFYFPELEREIDWTYPPEPLETELRGQAPPEQDDGDGAPSDQSADRKTPSGDLQVDKLFKVRTVAGEYEILVLHVEVQGEAEAGFPERMYVYNGRAFDFYRLPVVSLAILGDVDRPGWCPTEYGWRAGGCRALLEFPVAKLLDYDWEELKAESNPFGLVTMAHRRAKETRARNMTAAKERLAWRLELTDLLFAKGWPKEQQHDLFRFIDLVLSLPAALRARFDAEVAEMEVETMDSFMSSYEEEAWMQGEEEGRKEGRLHQMRMLQRLLTRRYGELRPWAVERLERATVEQLDRWGDRLFDAETVEELFADDE